MLDLRWIRESPDEVRDRLAIRGDQATTDAAIDRVLELDAERRGQIAEGDELKARRNSVSREVADRKRAGEDASDLIDEMRDVGERIKTIDARLRDIEAEIEDILLRTPNVPHAEIQRGGEEANSLLREWGEKRSFDFAPKPHWELGEKLGILDLAAGARVAGSGFPVFRGAGSRLQRALINWMIDVHSREHGYTEISPPFVVHQDSMKGTGQYPKFVEDGDAYEIEQDGLYLIPTAEVPVTNLHRGELLEGERLPFRYVAYSPCFRREAGAAGKDTRGLLRVHQFDKVELVRYERMEDSEGALEELTSNAEKILQYLELPYRVLQLAGGDLGFSSNRTYDLEVWAPGVDRWLEVSSSSNMTDFQARRADLRYRPRPGEKPEFVHTLNASGIALPRTIIAILENGQQEDGSVVLPEVLQPYMGTDRLHC